MAETILTAISRKLKRGYTVSRLSNDTYGVLDPEGNPLKDGRYLITFRDEAVTTGHFYENMMAALRRAGAIQPRRKSVHTRREAVKVRVKDPKNSVILANETLRDPKATPRERALARNFLSLVESNTRMRALAKLLGDRLKELEDGLEE